MTRDAQRLLALAFKAHQRGEKEIAGRLAVLAFDASEGNNIIEATEAVSETDKVEDALRKAEASAQGNIFSTEGVSKLLAIAEKVHQAGYPKVAKSIANIAQ